MKETHFTKNVGLYQEYQNLFTLNITYQKEENEYNIGKRKSELQKYSDKIFSAKLEKCVANNL